MPDNHPLQLDGLATQLAQSHKLDPHPSRRPLLLERLQEQATLLQDAHNHFVQMPDVQRAPSYTAEWLLDNFYIIQHNNSICEEFFNAAITESCWKGFCFTN